MSSWHVQDAVISAEYLAGFIDGEGYIALGRIRRAVSPEYPVRVVAYNTNRLVLEEIGQDWGGTLSWSASRKPHWKSQYALIWTNAAAAGLLARLAPCLRIKTRQANAVLGYYAHLRGCRRTRDSSGRLTSLSAQELEFREGIYCSLKSLNARGRQVSVPERDDVEKRPPSPRVGPSPSPEYLAGLIDGEGSLMVTKTMGRGCRNAQYRARISLSNTHRAVLEDVQRTYGGILVDDSRSDPTWKPSYQLVWTDGAVETLTLSIRSHLHVKRAQAGVILDFVRHKRSTLRRRKGRHQRFFAALSPAVVSYREELYNHMRMLNLRGTSP